MYTTSIQFIIYRGNFPFFTKIQNSQFLTSDAKSRGLLSKMYKIIPNSFRLFFYTFTIKYQTFLEKWCINGLNILQFFVTFSRKKCVFEDFSAYIWSHCCCKMLEKAYFGGVHIRAENLKTSISPFLLTLRLNRRKALFMPLYEYIWLLFYSLWEQKKNIHFFNFFPIWVSTC